MELHSYAKRRTTKKWSIEQKRQLVEARIVYDALFEQQPNNSVAPWKKVMSLAKLDDYNVFFVRKQWANMIEKYKQYKQNRLGNTPTKAIDNEMLEKLKQEWEFFIPIHNFMTRKTTNLHSYALTSEPPASAVAELNEDIAHNTNVHSNTKNSQETASNSSNEHIIAFSSDTNEDYAAAMGIKNDHDFYSKKSSSVRIPDKQRQYFADASEDTQESMLMEMTTTAEETVEHEVVHAIDVETQHEYETKVFATFLQQLPEQIPELTILQPQHNIKAEVVSEQDVSMPHVEQSTTATATVVTANSNANANNNNVINTSANKRSVKRLSERDKYYRHKRRFNHRLEQRFDAVLNVFGQIVKAEYPSIDISSLLSIGSHNKSNENAENSNRNKKFPTLSGLMNTFLSTDDDDDDDGEQISDDYETNAAF